MNNIQKEWGQEKGRRNEGRRRIRKEVVVVVWADGAAGWRMRRVDGLKERQGHQSVIWYWPHLVLGVVLLRGVFVLFVFHYNIHLFTCVCVCFVCPPSTCCSPPSLSWTHVARVACAGISAVHVGASCRCVVCFFFWTIFPFEKEKDKHNKSETLRRVLYVSFWTFCYGDAVATWSDDNSAGRVDSSIVSVSTSHSIGD